MRLVMKFGKNHQAAKIRKPKGGMGRIRSALYAPMIPFWRWRPRSVLDFSVVFQNLLDPQHQEFSGSVGGVMETEVKRSV